MAGMQPCTLSVTGRCWASVGLTLKVTHPSLELLIISRAEQGPEAVFLPGVVLVGFLFPAVGHG